MGRAMLSLRLNSLPDDWLELFKPYLDSEKGQDIIKKIDDYLEVQRGNFHPVADKILAPFHSVSVERVKVVIVGHFPYPNPIHVTGLPFSNPINVPMAKSLKNICDHKFMKNEYNPKNFKVTAILKFHFTSNYFEIFL